MAVAVWKLRPLLVLTRFFQFQDNEHELLNWILDEDSLEIPGKIEKVNPVMLENILSEEPNVVAYFYAEDYDKKSGEILKVKFLNTCFTCMGLKELNANKKILKFKALYRKPNFYSYMCSTRRTTSVEGFT